MIESDEATFTDKSIMDVMQKVKHSIQEAKRLGLQVRFTIEDASRTDWNDIESSFYIYTSRLAAYV
ncbi:hypothetical protein [Brevibacillus laterosporus]|uniref:hypothetical protein n=1 Tax=Brevibacillus laterosporus TaxID=1465 RepID=UPI003D23FB63